MKEITWIRQRQRRNLLVNTIDPSRSMQIEDLKSRKWKEADSVRNTHTFTPSFMQQMKI